MMSDVESQGSVGSQGKTDVRESIAGLEKETRSLNDKLEKVLSKLTKLDKLDSLDDLKTVDEHQTRITHNESQISELQAYQRLNTMVISGIPEENIDPYAAVLDVALFQEVLLEKRDIDTAHWLPAKNRDTPSSIMVKFVNRWTKETLVSKKRNCRNMSTEDLGYQCPKRYVFFNDHLTPATQQLLFHARVLKREKELKQAWSEKKVFVSKTTGGGKIYIPNLQALNRLVENAS